jgi:uncharacterized protein
VICCLDANIIIYYVERNTIWHPKAAARFGAFAATGVTLAVSDPARLESLVGPLNSNDTSALADYRTFFGLPSITMLGVNAAVWERAAQIRASFKLQALDSIHLASAIEHGCDLFLTNDAQLTRCTLIAVEALA